MCNLSVRLLVMGLTVVCFNARASGHGSPLHVDGTTGKLVVSGGLILEQGYAARAFDPSEEGGLDLPGTTVRTDLPGFVVTGVPQGSELQLELIPRWDLSESALPLRWLWYWDPVSTEVRAAANDPDFLLRRKDALGQLVFDQYSTPATTSLNVTDSLTPESHQHYLRYELDIVPATDFGVYGFFARVKSPGFEASNPFLIAFTYGVGVDPNFLQGAEAINEAAGLAGDFDTDGDVDGRDFLAWQRSYGTQGISPADGSLNGIVDAADLALWKESYGIVLGEEALHAAVQIPEPSYLIGWLALFMSARFRRDSSE
jgi:hypothetical protein